MSKSPRDADRFAQLAAQAPHLRVLDVACCNDQIGWVSVFVLLDELRLRGHLERVDLTMLTPLVNLKTLCLLSSRIVQPLGSLAPLQRLTNLKQLKMCHWAVADLEPLVSTAPR